MSHMTTEPDPTIPTPAPVLSPADDSVTGMTSEEIGESLTGFEEIAIAKAFGKELGDLPGTQPLRAFVMIWHKREGLDDRAAYELAMNMTLKVCMGYFAEDLEYDLDHPETESGKEGSLDA